MISRSFDTPALVTAMEPYRDKVIGFDPQFWLNDLNNIALTDGEGSYILLEYESPGVYYAHNFYTKRGKAAVALAKEAVAYAFDNYPIEVAKGLTPLEHLGARWLARKSGFSGYGVIQTLIGPCEMFIMTRNDYE